jgi:predicted CXXCH cytochrome family protein
LLVIPGLVVLVALAFVALPTGTAKADNGPHRAGWGVTTDGCAACHRVHRGVNEYLLLNEVETLCLSCHGDDASGSVLNVESGSNESTGGALRGGGFVRARIDTTDASLPIPRFPAGSSSSNNDNGVSVCWQDGDDDDGDGVVDDGCRPHINALAAPGGLTQSSHSIDGSLQTIWGNGAIDPVANPGMADYDLECGKCHDPHGTGTYRILREVPEGSGGAGYAIPDTYPKDEDAVGNYDRTNYFDMTFTGNETTDEILKDTAAWCSQCHTRYLAARNAPLPADASREDSGDAIFTFRHTSAGWGNSSADPPVASNNNRACITCHAAHGSNATAGEFSGPVPNPGAAEGSGIGAANSKLLKMNNRGMCQKCHNK